MTGHDQTTTASDVAARRAHHDLIGQPHTEDEGPIARAETTADGLSSPEQPLGRLGPPLDRRSAFLQGSAAASGVVLILAASWLVYLARSELVPVTARSA